MYEWIWNGILISLNINYSHCTSLNVVFGQSESCFLLPTPNNKKGKKNIIGEFFPHLFPYSVLFLTETIFNTIERHSREMVHVNRFSSSVVVSNRANLKNHLIQAY